MDSFKTQNRLPGPGKGAREGGRLLSSQRAKDSRHVSRGHRRPVAPAPGHSALGSRPRPPHAAGTRSRCGFGGGGAEGEPEVGEPECSSNCEPERKFKVPKRAPPPAPANRSPRAQGSALPGPVTASRALPEISPADEAAGWGHPDLSLVGGVLGRAVGVRPLGVSGVRTWEAYSFKGQVRVWRSPPRPHQRPEEAAPPWGGSPPHPGRPRFGPIRASGRAGRPGEPEPCASGGLGRAERPRWETPSQRFAPYLPSVRPILFSALKTDMSNWQLVPNRVQRSLVEHFYSCLLQLDAYSCRLNEKQNVL